MDIGTIISNAFSGWNIVAFVLAIGGFILLILSVIRVSMRLGKAGWRFGLALFGKKIMVVADEKDYATIRDDLIDSGLIQKKNIEQVHKNRISHLKDALLIIISYGYLENSDFIEVVKNKDLHCGLIVYCSPESHVSSENMSLLNSTPFTTLCNFRGRLVNDVLLMMLSTSFKKKDWERQKERQA